MATTINAGRVRFVSRGTYNNSTQYYLFDLVDYNGSSYIAKENTLGNLPTNTQYWQLIAEKGNTGSTGQTGPVGPTGNGIASITKTGTSGLVDTYTITYTNGNTTTFTITNGEDGEVTETELDVLRQKVANQQKVIDQLPQVTGQGTSITLENTIEAQFTKFEIEGNSTQDGTPSPDYPSEVKSCGDNGSINEVICNNQMFNKANEIVGQFINSNSVISRNENWNTSEYISVKKGSTICWSYETVGAGQLTINEFNDAKSFIKQTSADYRNNNGNELVVTLLNDTSYVKVGYRNNLTCDNLVLEYGNKRSGFREYKESQTYTIPTQQPMRSIGDVRDKFILKENGKWYERHYIGEIVLNGSESWRKEGVRYYMPNLPNAKNINDRLMCYSNMFKYTNASDDYGMFTNGSRLYLYYSIASNTDEFKTMLSEKKPYVLYQLATPEEIECTPEQIQQLENLPSTYKDFTIIQSEDETEAYLEVSGIYDLNNLINN